MILGGLVTSTVLNLGLMPALYLAFGKAGGRPEDEEAEADAAESGRRQRRVGRDAAPPAPMDPSPSTPTRAR